jgi:hypothetical protein
MGTKSASSYTKQPRKSPIYASSISSAIGTKATSPYFYGIVTRVNNESREVFFDILSGQNIGSIKAGSALPFYKDNLTLPQIGDTIPLLNGPSPESGILGEAGSTTLFYLPPISVNQELAQNTIIRTSTLSPIPINFPSNENYLAVDNGYAFSDNSLIGAGTQFPGDDIPSPPESNVGTYEALVISGLDDKDKTGFKKQEEQLQLFKDGFGINRNVAILRHNVSLDTITTFLRNNPNIPVFLFSKGCDRAVEIMNSGLVAPSKLYIIEPYSSGNTAKKAVEDAVRLYKVPMKNVFSGGYPGTGSLINVNGQQPVLLTTAMGRTSHWAALTTVAKGYVNGFIGFKSSTSPTTTPPNRTSTNRIPTNRTPTTRASSGRNITPNSNPGSN